MILITMPVPNLDEMLARVQVTGGQIVEAKMLIPGIGWYATCAKPGGPRFGVIEAGASAK